MQPVIVTMKNTLFNQRRSELCTTTQKSLTLIITIGLLLIIVSACAECDLNNPTALISGHGYQLQVELAMNTESQRCGLSLRNKLAMDHGMLFVFDRDQVLSFWMKNTWIPLSIAFLTAQGDILNIHDMQPLNQQPRYPSSGMARYALEVNQGWFARHRIKPGDRIQLPMKYFK